MATGTINVMTNESGTGYCKFPDGTLMCWGNKIIPISASDFQNWTTSDIQRADLGASKINVSFPVNFIAAPAMFVTINNDAWAFVLSASAVYSGIDRITIARQNAYEASYNIGWLAIGRWK